MKKGFSPASLTNQSHLRGFASDNYAGICPEAMAALNKANAGHAPSYGDDPWTTLAADAIRDIFETNCDVFFTFNGTAANSLAISHVCQPYHSIICHQMAHIETDECGAPEFFSNGSKILNVHGENGKLDLAAVESLVTARNDIHYPKPRLLSITQATECGTVYSVDDLRAVHEVALRHRLAIHMDGARFANAVASLDVAPKEITWKVGVNVLCLGSTKNGTAVGDAVVFFDRSLSAEFEYRCKQSGQLASKMRFLSAPLAGLLSSGAWLKNAGHANAMAARLAAAVQEIPGISLVFPRQANSVFLRMPETVAAAVEARGWHFYDFIAGAYRLMCSWDTTPEDVDAITRDIRECARTANTNCPPG